MTRLLLAVWLLFSVCAGMANAASAPPAEENATQVTLLVHGITWNDSKPLTIWGQWNGKTWNGLIGELVRKNHRFGGVIKARGGEVELPENLDTADVADQTKAGNLFVLQFSAGANVDGLLYKAHELQSCLKQLRQFTGCTKVRIVAHSAGGLVSRAYLQEAGPGLKFDQDVDRLITIGTPHLGAAIATHFGDFLGTRATSLKPESDFIRRLNNELDLPTQVNFASIVVRGFGADVRGSGSAYEDLIEHDRLRSLPIDFQLGGDQVVHVRSQNLALSKCASRYEKRSDRPVQYLLARVKDPSPEDLSPFEKSVHTSELADPEVIEHVCYALEANCKLWTPDAEEMQAQMGRQLRLYTLGVIEHEALAKHPASEVRSVDIEGIELTQADGAKFSLEIFGQAHTVGNIIGFFKHKTPVKGSLTVNFDRFGRVVESRWNPRLSK